MLGPSLVRSLAMLHPMRMVKNPVMFVAEVGAALTTLIAVHSLAIAEVNTWYFLQLSVILWLTVLFANFEESVAEARGRAQAASLRSARKHVTANEIAEIPAREIEELPRIIRCQTAGRQNSCTVDCLAH